MGYSNQFNRVQNGKPSDIAEKQFISVKITKTYHNIMVRGLIYEEL